MPENTVVLAARPSKKFIPFILMGIISIILYSMLYFFSADIVAVAKDTGSGHKDLFFVPIVIAIVFSLAHGSFTSRFWDVLGVKAKS